MKHWKWFLIAIALFTPASAAAQTPTYTPTCIDATTTANLQSLGTLLSTLTQGQLNVGSVLVQQADFACQLSALQVQVAQVAAAISDLQARVTVLEAAKPVVVPPPPPPVTVFVAGATVKAQLETGAATINVRSVPTGSPLSAGGLLGTQVAGTIGTLVGTPLTTANGTVFWQVNFVTGISGWVGQASLALQ